MEDKDKPTSEKVEELLIWASNTQKNFDKPIKSLWEQMKESKAIHYPPTAEEIEATKKWLQEIWNTQKPNNNGK